MNRIDIKEILSFEVDLNTAKEFEKLIYNLEDLGVYMDFTFHIDDKFSTADTKLIHIEKSPVLASWEEISQNEYHYFKSKVVTVNLEFRETLYPIFSAIALNKMTNLIYDFYEGPEYVYISFFINGKLKEEYEEENEIESSIDNSIDNIDYDEYGKYIF